MTPCPTPKQVALFALGLAALFGVIAAVLVAQSMPNPPQTGDHGSTVFVAFLAFLPIMVILIQRHRNR